ncbi:hypothetical protein A6411_10795 [Prescottella equi]|uniref:hypothetical protein n=1 Tax=Rhodococcus hoagii TaxID=43767 RepID=UPI0009BECE37|nr:hypothetical protein [Prescottella equi]OQQ32285.1 hypothetical protein A6411_10795 [Prescottella equi]
MTSQDRLSEILARADAVKPEERRRYRDVREMRADIATRAEHRKHSPAEYHGEDLCPRCGIGAVTGWRYPICADRRDDGTRWPHEETCQRYTYGDLCADCERTLILETQEAP